MQNTFHYNLCIEFGVTIARRLKAINRATALRHGKDLLCSSRAEPNSGLPRLMISNGVLLPCLNQNGNFI